MFIRDYDRKMRVIYLAQVSRKQKQRVLGFNVQHSVSLIVYLYDRHVMLQDSGEHNAPTPGGIVFLQRGIRCSARGDRERGRSPHLMKINVLMGGGDKMYLVLVSSVQTVTSRHWFMVVL
jgi:hypothetical protein